MEKVEGIPSVDVKQSKNFPYPIPESFKLFLFNKPRGLICDWVDPKNLNRPTIFQYIKKVLKDDTTYYCIGKLDFNARGLLLLTNSPEYQHVIEKVANQKYQYLYRIKVHGRFTDEKLEKLREGMFIKGKKCGPFICNPKKYLNRNTIILLRSKESHMRDVKLSL